MASPDKGSVDLPLMTFGGRVTQYDPQTLPSGASPFCQDVQFSGVNPSGTGMVAGVASRAGLGGGFFAAPFAGNPTVNYIKTFVDPSELTHLLTIDGLGVFRDESPASIPPGVPNVVGQVIAASILQSDALFGREFIAISTNSHPGFGIDIPRQYDGTNFDRVSQVGPGAPPTAIDSNLIFDIDVSPTGAIQSPNLPVLEGHSVGDGYVILFVTTPSGLIFGDTIDVTGVGAGYDATGVTTQVLINPVGLGYDTVTYYTGASPVPVGAGGNVVQYSAEIATIIPIGVSVGQTVTIAGVGVADYDGVYPVRSVIDGSHFTVELATNGNVASGGGTVVITGHIAAGLRQFSVSFVTRQDYITKPAPFGSWTAAGGLGVQLTSIPTGPPNVIARIVMFTPAITAPATGGPFFYFDGSVPTPTDGVFPSMVINDNVTTSATFDFLDAVLELGTASSYLFDLLELGECASVLAYSNRLFWSGERNKIPNFNNLTFDGGYSSVSMANPLGWTVDPVSGAGGSSALAGGMTPYWGDAYTITGDGATALRGMITQSAYQDYLGVPIIQINTGYSVRVRAYKGGGLVQGKLTIELYSPSAGSLGTLIVDQSVLTGAYQEFIGVLAPSQAAIPADLLLRVYGSNTLTNGGYIVADCIEPYPTLQPFNNAIIRGSYAEDQESYDQTTGQIIVGQAINQSVRKMFTLLDNKLYIETERGLYVTQDDGANEPSLWAVNTVSPTVGTGSVNGSDSGEGWEVIAYHDGAYIFWGSEPVKISQEIQPDWDTINWLYDQTIYVKVDTVNKRIIIGAPTGASTIPNVEFVCDYAQLANAEGTTAAEDIASHPQAYYSVYNPTKVVAPGKARKWTIWNIAANTCNLCLQEDGSYHLLRGNNIGNGKVYDQLPGQLSDDGAAINSQYQTAYMPQMEDEQALQLGSYRKLYKYLGGYAFGSGTMSFTYYGSQNQRSVALSPLTLKNPAEWDFEKNTNWIGERVSLLFGTNAPNAWWELTKLSPTLQRDLVTPNRGVA